MLFRAFTQSDIRLPRQNLDAGVTLTYLGTAGFIFSSEHRSIVVDPFLTRSSWFDTLFRPLRPDSELIAKHIPRANEVIIGHSHHDHILDGPEVCIQTGARFVGSPDACRVARAALVPENQIIETMGEEVIPCGEHAWVKGYPSAHGRVYFNRVTLAGEISNDFTWPARLRDFRHGLVLNWQLELGGLNIFHIDSAEFIAEKIADVRCDVLCLCAIGRRYRPNYVRDIVRIVQPKMVIACHWDWFWVPYGAKKHYLLPQVDLDGFVQEIEDAGVEAVVLPIGHTMML